MVMVDLIVDVIIDVMVDAMLDGGCWMRNTIRDAMASNSTPARKFDAESITPVYKLLALIQHA